MTREEHADYVRWLKSLPRRKDHFRMPCPECSATRSNPKDPSFSVHITREGGWAKCFHCDFAIAWNEDEMWKREQKQQDRERQKQQKDASQHHNTSQHHDAASQQRNTSQHHDTVSQQRNTSQHHDTVSQHHNTSQHHDTAPQQRNTAQRKPHIPLQPPVHYVCPVINKNKQIMNGEMMEYMVGRRGIPMDVLTRMKIEERLEFLPQTGKEEACICFPYLEDGVMKNMKFRDAAKHFKMVKGAELIPWNIDAIKGKEKCYITEGEIDALSLIAAGLEEVVSVPNGAGGANLQWLDRFVESHFDDKTEIILAMDTDRRGVELRDELVRRLGVDRCKVVAWGEGCKDANEYLLKYDLPRLRQQVEQAAEIPLEGVFCPMDEWDTLMDIYYNGMPEGADTGLENLDRLIKFERGFVLTVTGVPGSGKSEFVDEIAMRLLLRHDWKVGYFSPENTPLAYHYRKLIRRVVGKRFEHKGMPLPEAGQAIRYLAQSVFSIMPKEDFSVESVLRIAAQLVSRKGVKVLVVDPFNRFEHQIPDWETETQYISRIFDEFSNFAVKHKVLLILVAHPTKLRREPGSKRWPVPTLYDINGSAAFFNKTDYGMVVDRNDELGQVLVRVAKVRFDHLGGPGDAFFAFSTYNGRYTPTEERTLDHNPPEPKWEHTNFLTEKLKPEQQGLGFNEGE